MSLIGWASTHSVGLLAGTSIFGTLTSVYLGCRGAIKANDNVRAIKCAKASQFTEETWEKMSDVEKREILKLTPKELATEVGKPMAPTIISVATTIISIILMYKKGQAKYAAMAACAKGAELTASVMEDAIKEKLSGDELVEFNKNVSARRQEALEKEALASPDVKKSVSTALPSCQDGDALYSFEGVFFYSSPERIKIAFSQLDDFYKSDPYAHDGVSVNDVLMYLTGKDTRTECGEFLIFDPLDWSPNDLNTPFSEGYSMYSCDVEGRAYMRIELPVRPKLNKHTGYGF